MPANRPEFRDPARTLWVWVVFAGLIAGMLPFWPVSEQWFGVPAWAVIAVGVSALTSSFIAWVIFRVWRETNDPADNDRIG